MNMGNIDNNNENYDIDENILGQMLENKIIDTDVDKKLIQDDAAEAIEEQKIQKKKLNRLTKVVLGVGASVLVLIGLSVGIIVNGNKPIGTSSMSLSEALELDVYNSIDSRMMEYMSAENYTSAVDWSMKIAEDTLNQHDITLDNIQKNEIESKIEVQIKALTSAGYIERDISNGGMSELSKAYLASGVASAFSETMPSCDDKTLPVEQITFSQAVKANNDLAKLMEQLEDYKNELDDLKVSLTSSEASQNLNNKYITNKNYTTTTVNNNITQVLGDSDDENNTSTSDNNTNAGESVPEPSTNIDIDVDSMLSNSADLQSSISAIKTLILQLQSSVNEELAKKASEVDLSAISKQVQALAEAQSKLQQQLQSDETRISNNEKQIADLLSKLAAVNTTLDNIQTSITDNQNTFKRELETAVNTINTTINTLKQDIAKNATSINTNMQDIAQLKTDVNTNRTNIETNKQDIASNKQNIETNKQSIEANKQNIDTNKQSIESNKQNIETNKQSIEANKQNIDTNKQNIETNKQNIEANKNSILKNAQDIKKNAEDILTNSNAFSEFCELVANNFERVVASITANKTEIDNHYAEFGEFQEAMNTNLTNITDMIEENSTAIANNARAIEANANDISDVKDTMETYNNSAVSRIEALEARLDTTKIQSIVIVVASEYNSSTAYSYSQFCLRDGVVYQCTSEGGTVTGEFDESKWERREDLYYWKDAANGEFKVTLTDESIVEGCSIHVNYRNQPSIIPEYIVKTDEHTITIRVPRPQLTEIADILIYHNR